jgi:hypothetical protein
VKELAKKMAIIRVGPESFREQQHNQPLKIKDQEMFDKTLESIHLNPVVAGFVQKPEDWKYSSAIDFCDSVKNKGIIQLNHTTRFIYMAQADACSKRGD